MKKISLLILAILFFANVSNATHFSGAEISYTHITGLDYKVRLKLYRDCKPGNAILSATEIINISSVSTSQSLTIQVDTLYKEYVDNYCDSTQTWCQDPNSVFPGFEAWVYEGLVTLPLAANDWVFNYNSCCRSNSIGNIGTSITAPGNPGGLNFCINTTLDNSTFSGFNNSVQYINSSQLVFEINKNYTINNGYIDPDGDSLDVHAVYPLGLNLGCDPVLFVTGYSLTNPFGIANPFSINNANGTIDFISSTMGNYTFAIQIDEYRNGVKIASSMRDFTFVFLNGTGNNLPTLSGINGGVNNFININVCGSSTPLTFTINSADADITDSTFVEWISTIPNATVTTNNAQNQTATFNWTPTQADVRPQPYIISFNVKDNDCPFPGQQGKGYLIYVNQCNTDSVWAGDANADFIVNNYDVLNIGLANGVTGVTRPFATNNWQAEFCPDWTNNFMSGINHKHADCNGDGIIDATDLSAVTLNYGQVHLKEGQGTQNKTLGFPDLYFDTNNITANQGSTLSIPVMFGSSSTTVNDVYGIAGTINILNAQTSTPIALSNTNSWIGNASNSILFTKNVAPTKLDFTMVRTNQTNVSGFGQIGTLTLPISSNDLLGSDIILTFSNVKMIKNDETEVTDFNLNNDTLAVFAPLSTMNTDIENSIKLYPNPVTNILNIEFGSLENVADKIELINIFGETISTTKIKQNQTNVVLNTSTLSKGIYIIKLINTNTKEVYNKRFVK